MTKTVQDAYIVAAVRTPVAKAPRGQFRRVRPDDLLAHAIRAALARVPNLDPAEIADVIVGCAMPEAEQGMNVARIGALLAGLPDAVPAMTINRFCASGLQAVALAADRICTGDADVAIAGGTESMSLIPMGGHKLAMNPSVFAGNDQVAIAYGMGITAERVAERWKAIARRWRPRQRATSATRSRPSRWCPTYPTSPKVPCASHRAWWNRTRGPEPTPRPRCWPASSPRSGWADRSPPATAPKCLMVPPLSC